MIFGTTSPNYGDSCSLESLREVALEAEKLGYESVWMTDHVMVGRGPYPMYENILDSFVSLGYLAGITRRMKLGFSVLVIALRNPIVVAKQLSTIDTLSNGRAIVAIGAGYNDTEFGFLGSNFHNRGKRVSESIKVIRALWKGEKDFTGAYTQFKDAAFGPLPPQKELEIWVGGTSTPAMERAISLGNAWHPTVLSLPLVDKLITQFRGLPGGKDKPITARIGLDSKSNDTTVIDPRLKVGDPESEGVMTVLCGDRDKNKEILDHLEHLGITHLIVDPNLNGTTPVRDQIESIRAFAGDFIAH